MNQFIEQLSQSVAAAQTVEELTRPLLEMLEAVTGLESTFLTTVDEAQGLQQILYSHNSGGAMNVVEGSSLPWADSPCRRAMYEGMRFTDDAHMRWADLQVVRQLGIRTHTSVPVHTSDGELYGTLCAVDSRSRPQAPESDRILGLFASLIARQVDRERLIGKLLEANLRLASAAFTDHLTGLPNRAAMMDALQRMLLLGQRQQMDVHVAFLDLDGFKNVNDKHGHDVGDQLLVAIAQRLQGALRAEDFVARIGGDEFVAIGMGSVTGDGEAGQVSEGRSAPRAWVDRLADATRGHFDLAGASLDYAGASVGATTLRPGEARDAQAALRQADEFMYRHKLERRQATTPQPDTARPAAAEGPR